MSSEYKLTEADRTSGDYKALVKAEIAKSGKTFNKMSDSEKKEMFTKIDKMWNAKNEPGKDGKIKKEAIDRNGEKYRELVRAEIKKTGKEWDDLSSDEKKAMFTKIDKMWNAKNEPGKDGKIKKEQNELASRLLTVLGEAKDGKDAKKTNKDDDEEAPGVLKLSTIEPEELTSLIVEFPEPDNIVLKVDFEDIDVEQIRTRVQKLHTEGKDIIEIAHLLREEFQLTSWRITDKDLLDEDGDGDVDAEDVKEMVAIQKALETNTFTESLNILHEMDII